MLLESFACAAESGTRRGKQTRENNREKVPLWADIGNGPRPPGLSGICPLEFHRIWIAGLSVCTSAAGAVETSSESLPCKASLRQLTVVHLDSIYNCQGLKMPRDGQHSRQTFLSCTRSTCNATDRYDRGVVHIYTDHHYYYLVHMCPTTKKIVGGHIPYKLCRIRARDVQYRCHGLAWRLVARAVIVAPHDRRARLTISPDRSSDTRLLDPKSVTLVNDCRPVCMYQLHVALMHAYRRIWLHQRLKPRV
jgi:hypothetical protein